MTTTLRFFRLTLASCFVLLVHIVQAQVNGVVFRDFNGNGTKDTNEPLVSGIVVKAYNTAGAQCATSTSSGTASPNYTLPSTCSGQVRIEFEIPATGSCVNSGIDFSSASGTVYGSSVQFVTATASNVNFAIHNPSDYNAGTANVSIFIPCYISGDPLVAGAVADGDWFVGYPYTNSGSTSTLPPTQKVNGAVIGPTWGVAYSKQAKKIFTSALLKRHVGLGKLGSGGIYMLTPTASSFSVAEFYDLDANGNRTRAAASAPTYGEGTSYSIASDNATITYLGANDPLTGEPSGLGVIGTNAQRGLTANPLDPSFDPAAFDQAGKVGLGDIDISDDGKYLFVVNLYSRKVVRLELDDAYNPTSVVSVTSYDIPATTCTNGEYRPWGLKFYRDKLYVGVVCSGENGGTNTNLTASVYELTNPTASATFNSSSVITLPLSYNKYGDYNPWTNNSNKVTSSLVYPQPILSDIEFTDNGDMVLGFMDRAGNQWGEKNRRFLKTTTTSVTLSTSGDILIAGLNCSTGAFTLESNGSYTSANGSTFSGTNADTQEGPGGKEFFTDNSTVNDPHKETALGALAVLKGQGHILLPAYAQSTNSGDAGTLKLSTANGTYVDYYELYYRTNPDGVFAKANGLGDVELSGIEAPIEIGNRVWKDTDNDGLQDAGETGINGVTVQLYKGATLVASTTTANSGQYYFNSTSTTALQPNTAYTIKLGTALGSGVLAACTGYSPLNTALAGNDANTSGVVSISTGNYGENDHTYDIGLISVSCSLTATVTPTACNSATNQYTINGTISLTGTTGGTATITDGTRSTTVLVAASATSVAYSLSGLTSGTGSHTVVVSLPGCGTAVATYAAPASCTVAPCGLALTVTPGLCLTADNTYVLSGSLVATNLPVSGTVTISSGAFANRTIPLPAGNASGPLSYSGLISNGQTYTVTASFSDTACAPISQTYTAPASCSTAPVCAMSAIATAGVCASATNTYSVSVAIALTNAPAGTITVSLPGSAPITQILAANTSSFTAVFAGLPSDGASHTATISLPGCGSTAATYTAPASCSVAPTCSVSAVVTAGVCQSATNTFSTTAVVTLSNPTAGILTITDGPASQTFATTAVTTATFTAIFAGITSDGASHTVTATLPACGTLTKTYTAPASCSVAPICSLSAVATAGLCASATNTYSSTAVVVLTNPTAGTLTITDGPQSATFVTTAGSSATFTVAFAGLLSDGSAHTVQATLPGCSSTTATYTAPASCSAASVCSLSVAVSVGTCATATNTYSATAIVTVLNPSAGGSLSVVTGGRTLVFSTTSISQNTFVATFNGLISDGATHPVVVSLPGCSSTTTTYTAPASCSVAPVCSISALVSSGQCSTATNTFSNTVTVTMTNPTAGTLTVSDGVRSVTFAVSATAGTVTAPAVFNGLVSDGSSHTVTVSLPGCSSLTTTYSAPVACTVCSTSLTTSSLPNGQLGTAYNQTLTASGGSTPYTYTLLGTLPAGLTLSSTGVISGTPTSAATSSFTVKVTDSKSCSDTQPLTILVSSAPVCSLTATATPGTCASATNQYTVTGTVSATNTSGNQSLTISVGTVNTVVTLTGNGPVSYTLSGLPSDGLTKIVSILSSATDCGNTSVTFTAPVACTICSLSLTTTTLPKGQIAVVYSQTITASGGTLPYNFSVAAGTLPGGLSLNQSTGVLSGTPTTSGTFPVTLVVTDARGCTVRLPLPLFQIDPAPQLALAVVVNSPVCNSATNTYVATGTVSFTNSPAGSLTITDNGSLVVVIPIAAGQTTASFSLSGISEGPATSLVTATLGTSSASTTYTVPASCTSGAPAYAIAKTVDRNRVEKGGIVTYTVSLTNIGNATGTNLIVTDQLSTTAVTFVGSATASTGTFTPSGASGNWNIASLAPGQVATLTVKVQLNQQGITYNRVTAPDGQTATVCTTVPFKVCANESFEFMLVVAPGQLSYQWSKDGQPIAGATTNTLSVTATGDYSVATTNTGSCPDGSCCPFVIESYGPLPSLTAVATAATCSNAVPVNDAKITLMGSSTNAVSYNIAMGNSFTASAPLFATNQSLAFITGSVLKGGLANPALAPGQVYTIRVYSADGCFADTTVTIPPAQCNCPEAVCIPVKVRRLR